ncbi:MAG: hypothetical protein KJ864_01120 [Candidatus Omnitrophica bacterium]|nr:hypothetical protein [Candidatus Omnitrophota bacterium]
MKKQKLAELHAQYQQEYKEKTLNVNRVKSYFLPRLNELGVINKDKYLEILDTWTQAKKTQNPYIRILFWNNFYWHMTNCWRLANGYITLESYHELKEQANQNLN